MFNELVCPEQSFVIFKTHNHDAHSLTGRTPLFAWGLRVDNLFANRWTGDIMYIKLTTKLSPPATVVVLGRGRVLQGQARSTGQTRRP